MIFYRNFLYYGEYMRIRRKPWARPELAACSFFVDEPCLQKGRWADWFEKRQPLHLELGCGKGGFVAQLALANPNINYLAVDIKSEVLAIGRREIVRHFEENGQRVNNIALASHDIAQIDQILSPDDRIERIYINFCNPWPKAKHKKRRLTYPRQLALYKAFLVKGGEVRFKTDDEGLFYDSLAYFAQCGFSIPFQTDDLHKCAIADNIQTEHEKMFTEMGKTIYACTAVNR